MMKRMGIVLAGVALSSGCVSDDRYRQVLDQNEILEKTNSGLAAENERMKGSTDDLKLLQSRAEAEAQREREARMVTKVAFDNLSEKMKDLANNVKVISPEGGVEFDPARGIWTLTDTLLFDTGKAEIRKQGQDALRRLAEAFQAETAKGHVIRVDGHTDDQPIVVNKDTYPSNWHLSGARALNVLLFLEQSGVDSSKLFFAGYGEHFPREANAKGHRGNKRNRRVEIAILQRFEMPRGS